MDRSLPRRNRIAAAIHTAVALMLSVAGNLLYHELHAGEWRLGHAAPLAVGVISSVPQLAAAAVTHLRSLMSPAPAKRENTATPAAGGRKRRPHQRTAPPNRTTNPTSDRTTAPGGPHQASAPPRQPTAPSDRTTTAPEPHLQSAPAVQRGSRPDPAVLRVAAEIWDRDFAQGQIHNRRTLQRAVNKHYGVTGRNVIGDRACQSVIDERRGQHRRAI
jgi:hypothetical protein